MNELVHIDNQQVVTDSRSVAEHFGKRHDHVMRDIEAYKKDVPNFGEMFHETTMPDSYGRQQKAYLMNCDGFSLLVMGFTGAKALEWKLKYINAFNAMEKAIKTPQLTPNPHYRTRMIGTAVRDIGKTAEALEKVFGCRHGMALATASSINGRRSIRHRHRGHRAAHPCRGFALYHEGREHRRGTRIFLQEWKP